jgi:diacylglycerol kinase family enzyme
LSVERTGHASDIIEDLEIDNYCGVAVLSGDGLITEVLNGILKRPDYRRALKFPILHLPLGMIIIFRLFRGDYRHG